MNLNVTLEFACYTQYGVYMYIFIYGKTSGPTITPKKKQSMFNNYFYTTKNNNYKTLPHFAVKQYSLLLNKVQLLFTTLTAKLTQPLLNLV